MKLKANGIEINYQIEGDGPVVTFSHSLACNLSMWDEQAQGLEGRFRVLRYDTRGHGQTEAPAGAYTLDQLAEDLKGLLDGLGIAETHFVGLSMGGMVGQELALRHPDRVKALVLANTTSGYPAEGVANWDQRIAAVREGGLASIADAVMQRWFHEEFRRMQPATVARWRDRVASTDRQGYLGWCEAIKRHDTTARLRQIRKPTLVIAGELDAGTPVAMSQLIAREIPNARLIVLPQASHLSVLEQPVAFEAAVQGFLAGL